MLTLKSLQISFHGDQSSVLKRHVSILKGVVWIIYLLAILVELDPVPVLNNLTKNLSNLLPLNFAGLVYHLKKPLVISFEKAVRFTIFKENCVWKSEKTGLKLVIWRKQVVEQPKESPVLAFIKFCKVRVFECLIKLLNLSVISILIHDLFLFLADSTPAIEVRDILILIVKLNFEIPSLDLRFDALD